MHRCTTHYEHTRAIARLRWSEHPLRVVRRWSCIAIATTALVMIVGCGPEDGRAVGGGLGADLGNHAEDVPRSKLFVPGTQGTEDAQP
jgi:hypothetical protein